MPYVSELLGKPVADVDGTRIGHLDDVIAIQRGDVPHPVVVAIVVKRGRGNLIVPMSDVVVLIAPAISLTKQTKDLETYTPGPFGSGLVAMKRAPLLTQRTACVSRS